MSSPEQQVTLPVRQSIAPDRRSLVSLAEEASRQLDICNACRYCEGLCAVFPALERRTELELSDVSQISNLCHDCRACFDACMYNSPHEFDLDLPKILSSVRLADYRRHVWPKRVPRAFSGWSGLFAGAVIAVAIVLALSVVHAGWSGLLVRGVGPHSPYRLIPYPVLVTLMLVASVYALAVMVAAGASYWRSLKPDLGAPHTRAVAAAVWHALTLRYLRGGGGGCFYPDDDQPSGGRRHLHGLVVAGFGLCLVSTISAAVAQDILGISPPYPVASVPVIAGMVGGVSLVVGCAGLIRLKMESSEVTSFAEMTVKDYGLLVTLALLGLSGGAVLATRDTPVFGIALLVHLAILVEAFAMAPYSKFVHVVFRSLALVRENVERAHDL